jgi:hypothetical protein
MTETEAPREPRAMLALIALADAPVPKGISLYVDQYHLHLDPHTIADGEAWVRYLHGVPSTYVGADSKTFLSYGPLMWHGWQVSLHVAEDRTSNADLDEQTRERLRAIAEPEGGTS